MSQFVYRRSCKLNLGLLTERTDLNECVALAAVPSVVETRASRATTTARPIYKFRGQQFLPAIFCV